MAQIHKIMNKENLKNTAIVVLFMLVLFFVILNLKVNKVTDNKSDKIVSGNISDDTCEDILFREQGLPVNNFKMFTKCNFISGQYGDLDNKNVFGVENINTGKKYIIGSKSGIFDQNLITGVVDDRYVFLVNSYEGESRYIMIDTKESWPTKDENIFTTYPKTIDQYVNAGLENVDIIKKF
jgi:hypothetical protein